MQRISSDKSSLCGGSGGGCWDRLFILEHIELLSVSEIFHPVKALGAANGIGPDGCGAAGTTSDTTSVQSASAQLSLYCSLILPAAIALHVTVTTPFDSPTDTI